jgi:hypothetical protein
MPCYYPASIIEEYSMITTEEKQRIAQYAITPVQVKRMQAWVTESSYTKAAIKSGTDVGTLGRTIRACKKRAAQFERAEHTGASQPDGYAIKGTSSLVDYRENPEGETILQWVKTDRDRERQLELMREAIAAMCDDIPRLPAIKSPKMTNSNLLNLYVITDYHFGMLSWAEETGEDWDVSIAESLLIKWFEAAIAWSPDSETGVLCNLGDLVHIDGLESITPTGHNLLDSDTRFAKIVRVVIRCIRRVVDMLLHKHRKLHIIMAEGNHDLASSVWLREMFAAMYERDKRITIDTSPDPYYCIEHGQTSLFFHHGHKRKPASVDDVFVAKFREVFGRTKFSYAHMGHMHHVWQKETNLMIVEQHRTLAAKDAYASRGGWLSGREASCITYHKDYGQTGRVTVTPDMVK